MLAKPAIQPTSLAANPVSQPTCKPASQEYSEPANQQTQHEFEAAAIDPGQSEPSNRANQATQRAQEANKPASQPARNSSMPKNPTT
jgi:hypothetical protein